jgi:hypothetical protein
MMGGAESKIEDSVDLQKFDGLFIWEYFRGKVMSLARRYGQMHNNTFARILNELEIFEVAQAIHLCWVSW